MIIVENLSKVYQNNKQALSNINIQIDNGMFGLIGSNGAGKTTLMRILATLLYPTTGRVQIFGHDISTPEGKKYIKSILGYLPQTTSVHLNLTIEQNLDYFAILKGIKDRTTRKVHVERALEQTGLTQLRQDRANTLSGGMKRRLGIAITLLNNPRLIIVDEPTSGLDPAERVRFRNVLFDLAGERIVILSTHIIEDVQQVCSNLAVIKGGRLLFYGSSSELIDQYIGKVWAISANNFNHNDYEHVVTSIITEQGKEYRVVSDNPLFKVPVLCNQPWKKPTYLL
ncbi:MAG: ATP-binding cassette domain-containing protein [Chloroflexi bacterium]|nr:ATP-binding cassette domain-containing protein [Chloroflexota bacterium]